MVGAGLRQGDRRTGVEHHGIAHGSALAGQQPSRHVRVEVGVAAPQGVERAAGEPELLRSQVQLPDRTTRDPPHVGGVGDGQLVETVIAPEPTERLDALAVGVAAWRLGAGRARKEDPVQAAAGVELHAKPGGKVRAGQPLLTLHTDTPERFDRALAALEGAWELAAPGTALEPRPLVIDRIAQEAPHA